MAARRRSTKGILDTLAANRRAALRLSDQVGTKRLIKLLTQAQRELNRRLRKSVMLRGPRGERSFTEAQIRVALTQIRATLRVLRRQLRRLVLAQAKAAAVNSAEGSIEYLKKAERQFKGVAQQRIAFDTVGVLDRVKQGTESSILHRIEKDPKHPGRQGVLDRYDENVIEKFEKQLQLRLIAKRPWNETVDQLIEQSPFLKDSPRYWAERIVRTETMAAHNRASLETMKAADEQLGGMVKILSATFDDRTGADSYAVHGQIRKVNEPFDWWGGSYQHPPNRPNDREIVIPHNLDWPIPEELKWKSNAEVRARWAYDGRKGSPPRRPKMTTVPLDRFGRG